MTLPGKHGRDDYLQTSYSLKSWLLTTDHNRVRGLYPWPHAHTYLDGARVIVLKTRLEDGPAPRAGRGITEGLCHL